MKHLTNLYDPTRWDARVRIICCEGETSDEARQRLQRFLADKTIGKPKATRKYSVEQLEADNIVGVYAAAKEHHGRNQEAGA